LVDRLAGCFGDGREEGRVVHELAAMAQVRGGWARGLRRAEVSKGCPRANVGRVSMRRAGPGLARTPPAAA
jgi:hypothetical protein